MTASLDPRPFSYRGEQLHCADISLEELATRFGTPLYVYSAEDIRARVRMLAEAFATVPHTLCYAVKANSSLAILRLLGELGCGFDIVSGGELERVRRAAPDAIGRVVFSGVGKQAWEMDAALEAGEGTSRGAGILQFNVESEAELELLAERARRLGRVARVALRVNPDVFAETHPYISTGLREHKFGIAIDRAREVYRRAAALPGLEPIGVSLHIGSQIREVAPFAEALARGQALVEQLRDDGLDIRYLDGGGGLGIEYGPDLAPSFDPAARVMAYAEGLRGAIAGSDVHLLLEPGRFIVAQAGALLTRVLYTKQNGTKHFIVTDAAMNDLIRPALYGAYHGIVPVQHRGRAPRIADVVGPVCESGDFFARDRELPAAETGELLAVLDAGAYGMSQSSQYNSRGRAAEVLLEGGEARLIRRRETVDELLASEVL